MPRETAPNQSGESQALAKLLGRVLARFGITPTTAASHRDYERMTDLPEGYTLFQFNIVSPYLVELLQKNPALQDRGIRNQAENTVLAILNYMKHVPKLSEYNAVGLTSSLVGYREDGLIRIVSRELVPTLKLKVITLEELQQKVQTLSIQAK